MIFLYIFFRYNTPFTRRSKNNRLITDITFSVILGPDKHLQVSECAVAVWSVTSETRPLGTSDSKSHPAATRFNQIICGKNIKISLPTGLRRMQERRKPLIQIKFKVFYSGSTVSMPH